MERMPRRSRGAGAGLPRITSRVALPTDGTPRKCTVHAGRVDAWSRAAAVPGGAVYLRRTGEREVEALQTICPHAGCFVGYSAERKVYQCPCHTSSFQLDGERIMPSPSPRNMDALTVDPEKLKAGEIWVQFVNYYPGKEHREEKPQ